MRRREGSEMELMQPDLEEVFVQIMRKS